jgi:hypothetical protein
MMGTAPTASGAIADASILRAKIRLEIRAVLTPCPFAGGREREILSAHPALDEVVELRPFLFRLLRGRYRPRKTLVLHLGGDRVYSLLIAKLLGAPAWVYGTSRRWSRWYQRCLVPNARTVEKLTNAGVPPGRIATVGEMVVDSVPENLDGPGVLRALGIDPDRNEVVSLMAGSRPYEVDFMLPFYADLIDDLAARRPSVRCLLPFSEFVDPGLLDRAMSRAGIRTERDGDLLRVRTRGGAIAHIVGDERYVRVEVEDRGGRVAWSNPIWVAPLEGSLRLSGHS